MIRILVCASWIRNKRLCTWKLTICLPNIIWWRWMNIFVSTSKQLCDSTNLNRLALLQDSNSNSWQWNSSLGSSFFINSFVFGEKRWMRIPKILSWRIWNNKGYICLSHLQNFPPVDFKIVSDNILRVNISRTRTPDIYMPYFIPFTAVWPFLVICVSGGR